jgi:hypothetical protein
MFVFCHVDKAAVARAADRGDTTSLAGVATPPILSLLGAIALPVPQINSLLLYTPNKIPRSFALSRPARGRLHFRNIMKNKELSTFGARRG